MGRRSTPIFIVGESVREISRGETIRHVITMEIQRDRRYREWCRFDNSMDNCSSKIQFGRVPSASKKAT